MTTTQRQQKKQPWLSLDSPYDTIAQTTIFFNSKENKTLSILILKKNSKERKKERNHKKERENKKDTFNKKKFNISL